MAQIGARSIQKVSFEQFRSEWKAVFPEYEEEAIKEIYDDIKIPCRATKGSGGYDFFIPNQIELRPGESIKIPTGIRVEILEGWCMLGLPKSGLGSRFRLQLDNTIGLIDEDYYNSKNEGHIIFCITYDKKEFPLPKIIRVFLENILFIKKDNKLPELTIEKGKAFVQGLIIPYGIVEGDETVDIRDGGFGSTKK